MLIKYVHKFYFLREEENKRCNCWTAGYTTDKFPNADQNAPVFVPSILIYRCNILHHAIGFSFQEVKICSKINQNEEHYHKICFPLLSQQITKKYHIIVQKRNKSTIFYFLPGSLQGNLMLPRCLKWTSYDTLIEQTQIFRSQCLIIIGLMKEKYVSADWSTAQLYFPMTSVLDI